MIGLLCSQNGTIDSEVKGSGGWETPLPKFAEVFLKVFYKGENNINMKGQHILMKSECVQWNAD